MQEICSMSLCDLYARLQSREVGVQEAVIACYKRIDETESWINALLGQDRKAALKEAEELDVSGPDKSKPLWGIPVTVKDALSTKGLPTTAASKILENFVPIYDAFVVERLRAAGAIILGKTNMDEFAMGSSTENSAFKKTRNPWDLEKVPGGSSGGSAASVACGQCFASLGSDTGGSIRQPAGFCGCTGLKPTYGRVSRFGLFAFASSLDQVGPIARTVKDCAVVFNVIGGHDARDNTSDPRPMDDCVSQLEKVCGQKPLAKIRVGFPESFFSEGLSSEVREGCISAINVAKQLGADIVPVELPDPNVASATYYIVAMAEASSNLARYDGIRYGRRAAGVSNLDELYLRSRSEGFGQEVKRRIMLGSYVLSSGYYDAYFKKAAQTRRIIYNKYQEALQRCDFICMPVAPETAWKLGTHESDPLKAYLMDAYTLPINLAGLPALSLPVCLGRDSQMPIGIQLVGHPFGEAELLHCGHILQMHLEPIGMPKIQTP